MMIDSRGKKSLLQTFDYISDNLLNDAKEYNTDKLNSKDVNYDNYIDYSLRENHND